MEKREYICGNCGAIYLGYFNSNSSDRYEPCPECGIKIGDSPYSIHTTDGFSWVYDKAKLEEDLKERGKNLHVLVSTITEDKLDYYRKKGLL